MLLIRKHALLMLIFGAFLPISNLSAIVLTVDGGVMADQFGFAVDISGSTAVVGADGKNSGTGAAYLFDATTGAQLFELASSDGAAGDSFGYAVGIYDNTVLVGAWQKNTNTGAAYLFDATTGTQTFELTASDATTSDFFGFAVDISGNTVAVGAFGKFSGSLRTGAAYLFDATTGAQTFKLTASDAAAGDAFGYSVGVSGNTVIVGADGKNNSTGAAYLFDATTGAQTFKLTASDGAADDSFGFAVSISGNTAVIGAMGSNSETGAAYLFDTTTGAQTFKLTALDGATNDQFGYSSGISGNTAIVGAIGVNSLTGAAYIFDTTTGTQTLKLTASDGRANNLFGASSAIDGDLFVVGTLSWFDGVSVGKAYSGSVSSMTTLDDGTSKTISGISFISSLDWIVGQNASGNTVTLSVGDTANITETGKAVYIGQNAGSNNNTLTIAGTIVTPQIYIGSLDGNIGNLLQFESTADYSSLTSIYLSTGNALAFERAWLSNAELFTFLGSTELFMSQDNISWIEVTIDNYLDLIAMGFLLITNTATNGMLVMAVPEPAEVAALFGLLALGFAAYRRRS